MGARRRMSAPPDWPAPKFVWDPNFVASLERTAASESARSCAMSFSSPPSTALEGR